MLRSQVRTAAVIGMLAAAVGDLQAQATVTLRDDAGREVRLAQRPSRIVSLVPVATEIIFTLQEGWRVVGRSRFDDYPPSVLAVPSVGDAIRPSVESVLVRRPDLVILIGGSDNADALREMNRLRIPYLVVVFNSLDDLDRNVRLLGRLVGREEEALELSRDISHSLSRVSEVVAGLERPRVYYDIAYPPAITAGGGSYLDEILTIAGGRNVFADLSSPSPRVSLEAIAARSPDMILYPMTEGIEDSGAAPGERPGWTVLKAVREGHVRTVDGALVHRLGPRVGLAAEALARALHPEAFEREGP